jgi:23S rRNA-/tRNA-specific pseudouridylate synthase
MYTLKNFLFQEKFAPNYSRKVSSKLLNFLTKNFKINETEIKEDYIVKSSDKCQYLNNNILEPPSIYFNEIEVIFEDDDLFVINSKKF